MNSRICILIPAHNEARTIAEVVKHVRGKGLDVVVVDDGSSDNSAQLAKDAGAVVLVNFKNQGKGFSLQRGFDYIISRDYDALITMDADGQHAVEDLDGFINLYAAQRPDVI